MMRAKASEEMDHVVKPRVKRPLSALPAAWGQFSGYGVISRSHLAGRY